MRSFSSLSSIVFPLFNATAGDAPSGAGPAPPGQPPAAPLAAAPSAGDDGAIITISSREMAKRNAEERASGRAKLLKEFGFEKAEDAAKAFETLKQLQAEKMSAEERTAAQIKALSREAEDGKTAASHLTAAITALTETLTDAQKAALAEFAPDGTPPADVLKTIAMIRKLGGAPAPPANNGAPPPPPAPATTTPAGAPKPGTAKTPYQTWQEMGGSNSFGGAAFYRANAAQIEATRPTPGA